MSRMPGVRRESVQRRMVREVSEREGFCTDVLRVAHKSPKLGLEFRGLYSAVAVPPREGQHPENTFHPPLEIQFVISIIHMRKSVKWVSLSLFRNLRITEANYV